MRGTGSSRHPYLQPLKLVKLEFAFVSLLIFETASIFEITILNLKIDLNNLFRFQVQDSDFEHVFGDLKNVFNSVTAAF